MNSLYADAVLPHRVSPFGYLRIEAYLQLPEAFRSLSRPSSAPDAKAFPLRSFMLDLRRACSVSFAAELALWLTSSLHSQLFQTKEWSNLLVLFRFELCRLICFTNKIVITHFCPLTFVSGTQMFPYCCLLIICIKCHNVQFSRCIASAQAS